MAEQQRIVKLGLGKRFKDMIAAVIGQMSDGYWENTPKMRGYWVFADAGTQGDECVLEISPRTWDSVHNARNLWAAMDDAHVKRFLADKIKFLIKEEGFKWDRAGTEETDYLSYSDPYKVKDAYYAYEVLKGRNVGKHPEYSESFYAEKDGKDYQIDIELEDGPNIEDPEKLTVIVGDEKETIDVPKGGADDHYRKAIDAGLKKLGYKMMEGKIPDVNEGKYPVFVKIESKDDYDKLVVPALGDILKKGYSFNDIKDKWFELGAGEGEGYGKERKKTMRQVVQSDGTAEFIFWYGGDTLDTPQASEYVDDMGMDASDYGISFDDVFEGKTNEATKKPLYAYIGYSGSWGDGDDEKVKLPAGDNYLDIVSKHFDMKPEEIDAKWRKKLTDCKTDADFGKILAAMYDAMEAFVFALRRGNECVWANPKGSTELNDKDWQGPDYDWLTANV